MPGEHRSTRRHWTGRPDVRPRCGTGRSPRSCTPQNGTPGPASPQWPSPRRPSLHAPIPRAWYKPAARAGSKTTTAARTRAAAPRGARQRSSCTRIRAVRGDRAVGLCSLWLYRMGCAPLSGSRSSWPSAFRGPGICLGQTGGEPGAPRSDRPRRRTAEGRWDLTVGLPTTLSSSRVLSCWK